MQVAEEVYNQLLSPLTEGQPCHRYEDAKKVVQTAKQLVDKLTEVTNVSLGQQQRWLPEQTDPMDPDVLFYNLGVLLQQMEDGSKRFDADRKQLTEQKDATQKQLDEERVSKDESHRQRNEVQKQLDEERVSKAEFLRQRNEVQKQLDEERVSRAGVQKQLDEEKASRDDSHRQRNEVQKQLDEERVSRAWVQKQLDGEKASRDEFHRQRNEVQKQLDAANIDKGDLQRLINEATEQTQEGPDVGSKVGFSCREVLLGFTR